MTSTTETGKFKSSGLPHGTVEHCGFVSRFFSFTFEQQVQTEIFIKLYLKRTGNAFRVS